MNRPSRRLYKYRELTARTLDMVVGDLLYFADSVLLFPGEKVVRQWCAP